MNKFGIVQMVLMVLGVMTLGFVMYSLHHNFQQRVWEKRWQICLAQARGIVAAVKLQYPGCEGAMNALTIESNLRQASSQYRNLPFEDLMDMLDRVDAASTPLFSMASRGKELGNTEFWTEVDAWGGPVAARGIADKYPLQAGEIRDNAANRRKVGNGGQAFREGYGAGWIAEQVPKMPGTGKGFKKRSSSDAVIYIRQSIEAGMASFDQTFTADSGAQDGNGGGLFAGIRKLVDPTNKYANANAAVLGAPSDLHTAPADACVAEGTALADGFSLDFIENAALAFRTKTNRKLTLMYLCGLGLRKAITGLVKPQPITGAANSVAGQVTMFTQDLKDSKLGRSIDVIFTDYATFMVKETDYIGTTTTDVNGNVTAVRADRVVLNKPNYGLMIDTDKLQLRFGVEFQKGDLADDGGSKPSYVRTYGAPLMTNPVGAAFQAFS